MERMDLGVQAMLNKTIKILVVCLGNICRSPALETVLQALIQEKGLEKRIYVESRGLSQKQVGKKMDARIAEELKSRGYDISHERAAKLVSENDFHQFDYILAVDEKVLRVLQEQKPLKAKAHIDLVSIWSSAREEIFDPYKESDERMKVCIDLVEKHAREILRHFFFIDDTPSSSLSSRPTLGDF